MGSVRLALPRAALARARPPQAGSVQDHPPPCRTRRPCRPPFRDQIDHRPFGSGFVGAGVERDQSFCSILWGSASRGVNPSGSPGLTSPTTSGATTGTSPGRATGTAGETSAGQANAQARLDALERKSREMDRRVMRSICTGCLPSEPKTTGSAARKRDAVTANAAQGSRPSSRKTAPAQPAQTQPAPTEPPQPHRLSRLKVSQPPLSRLTEGLEAFLDRPALAKVFLTCGLRRPKLVIAKLDRLCRDAHFLLGLEKAGVDFVAADLPTANRLTVGIMATVAGEEQRLISRRTKEACVDAPFRARRIFRTAAARGRVLPCVRPLVRQRTRRGPVWEMLWGERRRTGIIVARQNRRSAPCPNSTTRADPTRSSSRTAP